MNRMLKQKLTQIFTRAVANSYGRPDVAVLELRSTRTRLQAYADASERKGRRDAAMAYSILLDNVTKTIEIVEAQYH